MGTAGRDAPTRRRDRAPRIGPWCRPRQYGHISRESGRAEHELGAHYAEGDARSSRSGRPVFAARDGSE